MNTDHIVGVKLGDHKYLFDWVSGLPTNEHSQIGEVDIVHAFKYYNDIPLNDANYDYRVNLIEYTETKKSGKQRHWSWVTKFTITLVNAYKVMRAARSR